MNQHSDANWINLSFYYFLDLGNAEALTKLRTHLKALCSQLQLKGTILIASEGVNAMLSGPPASVSEIRDYFQNSMGIPDQFFKETPVTTHSFNRMLVKIKKEIIPVGDPDLKPVNQTAQRISASELKKWLDEMRNFVLLDTRNDYEIEVGTFEKATHFGLTHSRQFATAAAQHLNDLQNQTVVTFCTGGIRCEKASALLLKLGLKDVYQLDGGILRYFEENGSSHFKGDCFVFDWRLAVDGSLQPANRSDDPTHEFGRHKR